MIYATGRARCRDAYEPWRHVVIEATREISEVILKLSEEVQQIRNITLQNRLALDLILSAQGGTCALIQQRCSVYVNDTHNYIKNKAEHLEQIANDLDQQFTMETPGWIKSVADKLKEWFSWIPDLWGWLKSVFKWIIIVIVLGVVLSILIKCCICIKTLCRFCNRCTYKVRAGERVAQKQYRAGYNVNDLI